MKLSLLLIVSLVAAPLLRSATGDAPEKPVTLAPYKVEARPFGFLGIKHATLSLSPLKLLVGMDSVKFLQIDELEPGSPGIAAGVQRGDRIVSIDGVAITKIGLRKLKRMNRELEVGQTLRVEVLRPSDGSTRLIEVVVPPRVKREPNQQSPEPTAFIGQPSTGVAHE